MVTRWSDHGKSILFGKESMNQLVTQKKKKDKVMYVVSVSKILSSKIIFHSEWKNVFSE